MVDPTSDLNEDVSAEEAHECATCGAVLSHAPDHRVITWIEDGIVQAAHFCDDDCRMDWNSPE